jgi:hypothetical protein
LSPPSRPRGGGPIAQLSAAVGPQDHTVPSALSAGGEKHRRQRGHLARLVTVPGVVRFADSRRQAGQCTVPQVDRFRFFDFSSRISARRQYPPGENAARPGDKRSRFRRAYRPACLLKPGRAWQSTPQCPWFARRSIRSAR